MPNPTWTCCADLPPCPTCVEACDFATSYLFDGFALQFQFSVDRAGCPLCVYEGGGFVGAFLQKSYSVNVDVTQIGQALLTRHGTTSDCCYRACGTMEVEWEITDDVIYGCCAPPNESSPTPIVQCTGNQTITGVEAVPYNYTVRCCPAPIDGCPDDAKRGNVWVHTLVLCGVKIATSHKGYVAECSYNPTAVDCGEEPRGALYMTGMVFRWFTPLIALDDIVPGMENAMCGPYAPSEIPCGACPLPSGCVAVVPYSSQAPFSVWTLPDGCAVDDCVPDCAFGSELYPTGTFGLGFYCGGPFEVAKMTGNVCPCGQFTIDCACYRVDAGWVAAYPNYV